MKWKCKWLSFYIDIDICIINNNNIYNNNAIIITNYNGDNNNSDKYCFIDLIIYK